MNLAVSVFYIWTGQGNVRILGEVIPMKYLQRLGKSLMLPVSCLPVASILFGIGYWLAPAGGTDTGIIALGLIKAGYRPDRQYADIVRAVGVAVGMADEGDGTAALAGLVSYLTIKTLLSVDAVSAFQGIAEADVNQAFLHIENQFTGILSGLIGSWSYNRYHKLKTPDFLAFFSGKRSGCNLQCHVFAGNRIPDVLHLARHLRRADNFR